MNMNTTTETNILTPIQALHRCLEWFTLNHPAAVLPGTKLTAVQELNNVLVMEELTQLLDTTETDSRLADAVELLRRWVEIINAKSGENKAGILAAVESLLNTSSRFIIEHGENTENPTA